MINGPEEVLRTVFYHRIRRGIDPLSEIDKVLREYNKILSMRSADYRVTRPHVEAAAKWAVQEMQGAAA